jgi:hypothetical protein
MPTLITNGTTTLSLPDVGSLLWVDERGWAGVVQSVHRVFGGAAVVQEASLTGAQPLTLQGGERWAVLTQASLDALIALLAPARAQHTVTLEDGREYTVIARRDDGPAVQSRPLPAVADSGPVDGDAATLHWLEAVRLYILAGPL